MKLLDQTQSVVTEITYTFQDDTSVFYYKEWWNRGKFVDCLLRDKDGHEIDDPDLLEKVQNFLD